MGLDSPGWHPVHVLNNWLDETLSGV